MPLYTYECKECGDVFDLQLKIKDLVQVTACKECGGEAQKIIVPGHGIQDDHPIWLDNGVRCQLQDLDDPMEIPIETRTELNKYLKDNGIIPRS